MSPEQITDIEERLDRIESELEQIRRLIPPRWIHWIFGVFCTGILTWGTWLTGHHYAMDTVDAVQSQLISEHRSQPFHSEGMNQVNLLMREMSDLRTDVRVIGTRLDEALRVMQSPESRKQNSNP